MCGCKPHLLFANYTITMQPIPLRTTVIGSYPFPSWLDFAALHLDQFGTDEIAEMQDDAVVAAVHDQTAAGLDVITDGEQTRFDFNTLVLRLPRWPRRAGADASRLRPARPRPARQDADCRRIERAAWAGRGGGISAPPAPGPVDRRHAGWPHA